MAQRRPVTADDVDCVVEVVLQCLRPAVELDWATQTEWRWNAEPQPLD